MTVIAGSSAFISLFSPYTVVSRILVAVVTLLTCLDLVIRFEEKIHLYDNLQQRFATLLCDIIDKNGTDITQEIMNTLQKERIMIEKDEPITLKALDILCHNEEAVAQGQDGNVYHISRFMKLFSHFLSFDHYKPVLASSMEQPDQKNTS